MANMPIYDLWGGKSRSSAAVYGHANGNNPDEVEEKVPQIYRKWIPPLKGYK
ncbi:MAG: hypothetical protein CM1200mP3_07740 [Chloroflexota bacterium]|nr:MAG: hypothetical protein CM1200mP3_07740 [Chloroflexota bacterium]